MKGKVALEIVAWSNPSFLKASKRWNKAHHVKRYVVVERAKRRWVTTAPGPVAGPESYKGNVIQALSEIENAACMMQTV
jgi:hypothetical protein